MKMNEYQELSKRTVAKNQTREGRLCNYALGITGEAGEVADIIKKSIFHGHGLFTAEQKKLAFELGDCLFYISNMADEIGLTLEQVATMNVEKLKKRFPNGFITEDSVRRVDTDAQ